MDFRRGLRLFGRVILALFVCWVVAALIAVFTFPLFDSFEESLLPDYVAAAAAFVVMCPFMFFEVHPATLGVYYAILVMAGAGLAFVPLRD